MAFQIHSYEELVWVKANLPNKSFVIGTIYNPIKIKITDYLEDCLEFQRENSQNQE